MQILHVTQLTSTPKTEATCHMMYHA